MVSKYNINSGLSEYFATYAPGPPEQTSSSGLPSGQLGPETVQSGEQTTFARFDPDGRLSKLAAAHPCYDERTRRVFGRMHLPVAPTCNLGCGYCERAVGKRAERLRRPGTAKRLLGPAEAATRAVEVATEPWPLRVVDIAGPGEPLANLKTFETLRMVRERIPNVVLCLSTNGLLLSDCLPTLISLGVSALTVTINTTNVDLTAAIYRWVKIGGARMVGREGARLVLARQWQGLATAVSAGLLLKVNSVLIPGITDAGLAAVAQCASELGAWIHNIMPLIPRGRMRNECRPTPAEIESVRAQCEQWMP